MLTLLIFAPCEKVIIGKDDDQASIISVLETIKINAPPDLPAEALLPLRWTVMSLWRLPEGLDAPLSFEQHIQVLRQDGSEAANGIVKFIASSEHRMYRTLVNFPLFPIGQEGPVLIKTRLRQTNPETQWADVAEFPLMVIHEQNPETTAQLNAPQKEEGTTKEG